MGNMHNNKIVNSAIVRVAHTVGEPVTKITDNDFVDSPEVSVKELNSDKQNTAILSGNAYSTSKN